MTPEQKAALLAALDTLPPSYDFVAGYGLKKDGDEEDPPPGELCGVMIRWPDTDEGREAAGLFAKALWAKPGAQS